jgi:hypothetical protein
MDIESKTRAISFVGFGELDTLGNKSSVSRNGKLEACDVVLSTARCAGSVKGNGLGTQEVVTWGNALGDGEVELSTCGDVSRVLNRQIANFDSQL